MNERTPWDDMTTPRSDYNVLLAEDCGSVPVYWGRDKTGNCLLIIELHGEHAEEFKRNNPSIHGVTVDLRQSEGSRQNLVLTLLQQVNQDLFQVMCNGLIARLKDARDSVTAMGLTLAYIKRWKAFLTGRKGRVLSPEEIRGLFAELSFLSQLASQIGEYPAVDAWCGPDRIQQDFIFNDTAVEVKSLSGRERNSVRISSEDQLEALSARLFLLAFRITNAPADGTGSSLNDIASQFEVGLADARAIEAFSQKLAAYGYAPLPDYDQPCFVISGIRAFQVGEEFPRLVRSQLPIGIARVSYDIELEVIARFECEVNKIFEGT